MRNDHDSVLPDFHRDQMAKASRQFGSGACMPISLWRLVKHGRNNIDDKKGNSGKKNICDKKKSDAGKKFWRKCFANGWMSWMMSWICKSFILRSLPFFAPCP